MTKNSHERHWFFSYPPQWRTLLCRLGFHWWSLWQLLKPSREFAIGNDSKRPTEQLRQCKHCGKWELRRIDE